LIEQGFNQKKNIFKENEKKNQLIKKNHWFLDVIRRTNWKEKTENEKTENDKKYVQKRFWKH